MYKILMLAAVLALAGCSKSDAPPADEAETPLAEDAAAPSAREAEGTADARLGAVLEAQSDEMKARYAYRRPMETIKFFGIEPGMTVLEGLPGRGWYTRILLPYLGEEGKVLGAAYELEMYALFPFANEEFMARQQTWQSDFVAGAADWQGESGASIEAFHFGSMPADYEGTADAVFFPRVLHNLARFQNEGKGDYLKTVLDESFRALKPGGILGVVQHEARPDMPDDWASGGNGYLKKSFVIEQLEAAGFEFVAESPINENPKDQPTTDDIVWRLPPTYLGTREDAELKAAVDAIGESNRMTLKFRKPQ